LKYILVIFSFLLLSSCHKSTELNVAQEAANITNDYVDTLTGSIGDAHALKKQLDDRNAQLQKQI
jgi:hypothetical protein